MSGIQRDGRLGKTVLARHSWLLRRPYIDRKSFGRPGSKLTFILVEDRNNLGLVSRGYSWSNSIPLRIFKVRVYRPLNVVTVLV